MTVELVEIRAMLPMNVREKRPVVPTPPPALETAKALGGERLVRWTTDGTLVAERASNKRGA
jgi:hypothetical protein